MAQPQPKRDIIAAAIDEGNATKESLMEVANVNSAGLASQFTYLRLTGKYPVKNAEGIYSFITEDKWAAMKEEALLKRRTPAAPKKSPEERQEALLKRAAKLEAALEKKQEAFSNEASTINALRLDKAQAEFGICKFELEQVKDELGVTDADVDVDAD